MSGSSGKNLGKNTRPWRKNLNIEKKNKKNISLPYVVGMVLRRNGDHGQSVGMVTMVSLSEWCYVEMVLRRNGATSEW